MASDAAELQAHRDQLEKELADTEAAIAAETPAEQASIDTPAPLVTPAPSADPPASVEPPADLSVTPAPETVAAANLPGGVTAIAAEAPTPAAAPAADVPPASVPKTDTPVLVALAEADGHNFVAKIRKVASKLLDEGEILEGDLLTPGESGAVNSVLVKAVGELIRKVGL